MQYEIRTTTLLVAPDGATIFDESASNISIEDDAGGEYVVVRQDEREFSITPEEWPMLRKAIDQMIMECRL